MTYHFEKTQEQLAQARCARHYDQFVEEVEALDFPVKQLCDPGPVNVHMGPMANDRAEWFMDRMLPLLESIGEIYGESTHQEPRGSGDRQGQTNDGDHR